MIAGSRTWKYLNVLKGSIQKGPLASACGFGMHSKTGISTFCILASSHISWSLPAAAPVTETGDTMSFDCQTKDMSFTRSNGLALGMWGDG